MIEALCSVLKLQGVKMIAVALEGLETLLKMGEEHTEKGEDSPYVMEIERCGGID